MDFIVALVGRRGSSPLARGLHATLLRDNGGEGIIPARAGFTDAAAIPALAVADHPRSRGVYASDELWAKVAVGSSPLARGLQTDSDK